jgi:hypothetical protein
MKMTQKELMEGNKIIAKFLGYEYVPGNQPIIEEYWYTEPGKEKVFMTRELIGWVNKAPVQITKGHKITLPPHVLCRNAKQLPFHETWNWVMKIVEKIEEKCQNTKIVPEGTGCFLKLCDNIVINSQKDSKKISTWSICVEAIQISEPSLRI